MKQSVYAAVEEWSIPTYPIPPSEEMPMFAETSIHQGTSGNPYPMRVVSKVDSVHREDKKWTVIRLENDYIRLAMIPAIGGRVFEAFDKVTGYDFLYRQHVIKPALIGAYGSWISGGIEFNWPFHHRPSTMMPVDYEIVREEDGSVIVWMSEHAPTDRTKGMVGIVLRPDASYFETRVSIANRTPHKRNFLWWENAAVAIHEDYRLIFPPDVTYVHHHDDAGHTTYPIAQGQYGADDIRQPKDISWHKNSRLATSYFAAPSKYDFFGGYDYRKQCGVLHIANHHVSPGKKMFTWGYGANADNWEKKLTDSDGQYAELMAGSYTDDQPDFTWLAPYETKTFSQYWYPTQGIGHVTFANLKAAVALDREAGAVRFNATSVLPGAKILIKASDGRILLEETADLTPSRVASFAMVYPENEKLTVMLYDCSGTAVLHYTEETPDYIHIPKDNKGTPKPDQLITPCELVNAGAHIDQYRNTLYKPDLYYLEALRRDPDYLPALKAMGEYYTRTSRFEEALTYLDRAWSIECRYNQNPEDGTVGYLRGICLRNLVRLDEAYNAFYRAAWSNNVISPAMTAIAALDGKRGDYRAMYDHAMQAIEKEARHPVAHAYAALALHKLGDSRRAAEICRSVLKRDPLNHLNRFVLSVISGKGKKAFFESLLSDPAQTALDIGFDLWNAGMNAECKSLIDGVLLRRPNHAMLHYTAAMVCDELGQETRAARHRVSAAKEKCVDVFPMRPEEILVLKAALKQNPRDGFAAYLLGCIYYHSQMYSAAAELWKTAIREIPDFYIPYRNLALAYFNHLGKQEEALELMRHAVQLHEGDSTLLTEMATVMQKLGVAGEEITAFFESHMPPDATDQIQMAVAHAYNAAGQFDRAEAVMRRHTFSPSEGAEFATAEPYMNACFYRGRIAMKEGRYEDALKDFRAAQEMPENLHVGFWNESVMMPYLYYEAEALKAMGRTEEADTIIRKLAGMKDVGMWNMGGEFVYYYAMAVRLGGEELRARKIMREAIMGWEQELAAGCKYHRVTGSLYNCFVGNGTTNRLAVLNGMLGYGCLYNGDTEGAAGYFEKSMELSPSAKIAFERKLLRA